MRVAFDLHATRGQPTGIGVSARWLFDALGALGQERVELVPVGRDDGPGAMPSTLGRLWWEQVELPKRLRNIAPDLVHLPGFAVPWRRSCPVVITTHDLIGIRRPVRGLGASVYWGRIMPATLGWADAIIADSEYTKKDIVKLVGIPAERITVVHLAPAPDLAPPSEGAAVRVAARHGLDGPYVLGVSSLDERKNLPLLVEAFARFRAASKVEADLALVGKASGDRGAVEAAISSHGVAGSVKLLGYVPDEELPDLYGACTCFVYPSSYEGFGLPPLEAMTCGAPVVTSRVTSLPEVLGGAAVYVDPPLTAEKFADAVTKMFVDDGLRRRKIEEGRAQAASFSWKDAARRTVEVYRMVLEEAGTSAQRS